LDVSASEASAHRASIVRTDDTTSLSLEHRDELPGLPLLRDPETVAST